MTVEQILSSGMTKTKKAFLLFDNGYTRRDVARLITNDNYGFAHNIWKKWNALQQPSQPQPQTVQLMDALPFEFNFNRRFGIELEVYNVTRSKLVTAFRRQGITLQNQSYNHTTCNDWKIVSDSSISGQNSCEIISPPLSGLQGLETVKKVCIALRQVDAKVNNSCGFHVHFEAADYNVEDFKNLAKTHIDIESFFDSIVPTSRRANNNTYCRSLASVGNSATEIKRKIDQATQVSHITSLFHTRYLKVNFNAYLRHGTIEFRQHSGTTTFSKIKNWILICGRMMDYVKANGYTNNQNAFLNESLQDYAADRSVDLAA